MDFKEQQEIDMKRVGNIWKSILNIENLREAHRKAQFAKKYYREVKMVNSDEDYYLQQIQKSLAEHTYQIQPSDYTISKIFDKNKERELCKLDYYPHRIIQWAIMLQIQPIFLKNFCYHTCASIPERGGTHAYKLVQKALKNFEGSKYCLKLDIKKFYANIDHEILKKQLRRIFKDKDLLNLLDKIIESTPSKVGVPIGSYLSQFLANFYLSQFDHWLKEDLKIKYVVRYMDDIVIFGSNKKQLFEIFYKLQSYLHDNLKLTVKENWQVFPTDVRGVDFIGYRFYHYKTTLRKSTYRQLRRTCNKLHTKMENKKLLNYSEFASINSYIGWLSWCNSFRLSQKYLVPLIPMLVQYYEYVIHRDTDKHTRKKLTQKYLHNLLYNLKIEE